MRLATDVSGAASSSRASDGVPGLPSPASARLSNTFLAGFGAGRLCLLLAFVCLTCLTYLVLDWAHTFQGVLITVKNDPWGMAHVFVFFYAISIVLLFPCMILQMVSGALYGLWPGMLVSWTATSLGQTLAFLLGRYMFRAPVKAYLHATWPSFPSIDAAIKRDAWKLVCLLRLSPVLPYNVLNYALALTPVSFLVFTAASCLATIPWTCLYVYLGTFSTDVMTLARGDIRYGKDLHLGTSIVILLFMVAASVLGYVLSHRAITAALKDCVDPVRGLELGESSPGLIERQSFSGGS